MRSRVAWLAGVLLLAAAASSSAGEMDVVGERARALWDAGEFRAARDLLSAHLAESPSHDELRWQLAQLQIFSLEVGAAAGNLAELVRRDPDDARAVARLAEAQALLGRPAEAARVYRNYFETHPERDDFGRALRLSEARISAAERLRVRHGQMGGWLGALVAAWLLVVVGAGRWIEGRGEPAPPPDEA